MRQGAEIAAREESAIRVNLVIEDDRSVDKKATLSATQKLLHADSSDVIFLWTLSTVSTISSALNQSKTPLVVGAYDTRIAEAGSLAFGDVVNMQLVPRDIALFFHSHGAKRVALVLAADDWSSSFEAPFKDEAQRLGMTVVSSETILPHETETRSVVVNLKRNRVDAVLAPLFGASLVSFIRRAKNSDDFVVVVCNYTPQPHSHYRVGVPEQGYYRELFNSDSRDFGGSNMGNLGGKWSEDWAFHNRPFSLDVTLPPLGVIVLKRDRDDAQTALPDQ
jgi:ABC-type branched-subunit amino acid transport system substrate-binding protein